MPSVITAEEVVNDICNELHASRTANELLTKLQLIPQLHKVRGVVPICVTEARRASQNIGFRAGLTQVVDGEAIACAVAFASKGTDRIHEKIHACLKKLKTTNKPEHFIVGFDDSNNFRRKLYSEFKSDRPNDPIKEELNRLRPMVIQHLRDSGMQVEVHTGREADDVLASVAMQCQILDTECMMVTEDKDCWQSLGPKTSIYSRAKDEFYGANWLLATHKIKPTQVIDWLCMVGKNGVQGVCGIGVKTASDLLSSCGTFIDTMHSDFIPEKIRATMKQFDYWTARSLHTLDRRLPIERAFSTQSNAN